MPKEYVLKRPVIDLNRLKKMAKTMLDEGNEDRQLAKDTLAFFRQLVDQDPSDDASKKCMTDCIKLAQSAKTNVTKLIELLIKMEDIQDRRNNKQNTNNTGSVNFFTELTNEQKNV